MIGKRRTGKERLGEKKLVGDEYINILQATHAPWYPFRKMI